MQPKEAGSKQTDLLGIDPGRILTDQKISRLEPTSTSTQVTCCQ